MEVVVSKKPILKNEFSVSVESIINLFKLYKVYVFGYGSLMYPLGWLNRGMREPPRDLTVTDLNGFERGPFGLYDTYNFYGIIRSKGKHLNGVITPIESPGDYYNLMLSEFVVGLYKWANYRVVDVTKEIKMDLPEHVVVHTVVNRPINRTKILLSYPAPGYYDEVIREIKNYHNKETINTFLATGGFKSNREVRQYIESNITRRS